MKDNNRKRKKGFSRRDFLKGAAYGTLGVALGLKGLENKAEADEPAAQSAVRNPKTGPKLFEKTRIKSLELPCRALRSATWTGSADEKGYVTDRTVDFYRNLGRGNIGLIVTGYQYILPNGMELPNMIGNYDDDQIQGLTRLTKAVHSEGGRIAAQIVHTGARASTKSFPDGWRLWSPSPVEDPETGRAIPQMTRSEILQAIQAYASAAGRSKRAGFDAVELHAAHGYGINQFLSEAGNRRGDAYGGSLKNRYRFLGEVLEAVRGSVGQDYPVLIKLSGHDYTDGGLVPDQSVQIARRLADDGIHLITLSAGSGATAKKGLGPARSGILSEKKEAYLADISAVVKEAVKVPVGSVGGIRSLNKIGKLFSNGRADYVAMARPFIREPHLITRWKSGDTKKSKCISCSKCFMTGFKGTIYCVPERKRKEKG